MKHKLADVAALMSSMLNASASPFFGCDRAVTVRQTRCSLRLAGLLSMHSAVM